MTAPQSLSVKKYRARLDAVACDVYTDRRWDSTERPTAIFLNGFPDFVGPGLVVRQLVAGGTLVVAPHFEGTYDSDGEFTPEGCRRTLARTGEALSSGSLPLAAGSALSVSPTSLSLVSQSFGAVSSLRFFAELPQLNCIAMFGAALHYSRSNPDYGCLEVGVEHYDEVRRTHPHTYRLGPLGPWAEILSGTDPLPSTPLGSVPVVRVYYGANDAYFDLEMAQANLPSLLDAYIDTADRSVQLVPGSGHPLDEVLSATPIAQLAPELFSTI